MDSISQERLTGWEIHGFRTMRDLDVGNMMEEAKARWLRPNEIHAILCNYKYFSILVKPVNLPQSGAILLFDRKMLRNFRRDGHSWKKKKDGKTVKEAHEHLKVGNDERIHVYYAHGEEKSTFVRRCYWLLDKSLEHIVLVHYRETQEGSPVIPMESHSSSLSDPAASRLLSEEINSVADPANTGIQIQLVSSDNLTIKSHEMRLHEINTLEWEELLEPDDRIKLNAPDKRGQYPSSGKQNHIATNGFTDNGTELSINKLLEESSFGSLNEHVTPVNSNQFSYQRMEGQVTSVFQKTNSQQVTGVSDSFDTPGKDGLQMQDSFGRWMNYIMTDSPGAVDDPILETSLRNGQELSIPPEIGHLEPSISGQIFSVTDVSPGWAFTDEETKILITGVFHDGHQYLAKSVMYCVCGDACCPVEVVQSGVFRCLVPPHASGLVNLYLSFDGRNAISQVLTFEYRSPPMREPMVSADDKSKWEEFRVQLRLAHLLFSSSKGLGVLSSKASPKALKEAKIFACKASDITKGWSNMIKCIENNKISFEQAKDNLFEAVLKNRLYEWLLERVIEGGKASDYDDQGQGVIHLCAILDYTWAVYPFSWSGLSLDYRDKFGWTALHWAAYCGREKMAAALLSAGAKPNLITDPNSQNHDGCIAADLASMNGYDGLGAYLAEKALVQHIEDMTIAGNFSGSLQTSSPEFVNPGDFSEEDMHLKETLAAYRTAADAAARIQAAFREQSFKLRTKAVEVSNPEEEARNIVAAMRIQHAFRSYDNRKKIKAAASIQYRFRTWKIRKDFLNTRRQAIKIQVSPYNLQHA